MACVAVASLLRTMELEFLQSQPRPILKENEIISYNKELIQSLHENLGSLMKQLDEERIDGVEAVKHLETKLRDVAFRVENEIEFQVAHLYEEVKEFGIVGKPFPYIRLHHTLRQAINDINDIKEELVNSKSMYKLQLGKKTCLIDVPPTSSEVDSSKQASYSESKMVGKDEEFKIIKKLLVQHKSRKQKVVSITGMGGIGKTTLATRVYNDPSIASHFDKRAWCVSSQLHNKSQMLEGLLKSMGSVKTGNDKELELQLYQTLKGQRYMVVIDDVWSIEAWYALSACFPDDQNGSRVLLTTRLAEVANQIGSNDDFCHQMQLLDERESWNLFCEKSCRSHNVKFQEIWRPVVKKCKGLPLAIVVIAGLFSKLNTSDEWMKIAKALNSSAKTTIDEECSRVLALSYNHLPYNLKACFLYLGIFPEDHEVDAANLARLWLAEGLVKGCENESFDDVAIRHIQDLMDRNLIVVSKRSSCGRKIKAFRMHDLLHAFCVREAQNENLLHVIHKNGPSFIREGFRWVSIQSEYFCTLALYSSIENSRSIFFFEENLKQLIDLKKFNLLRVLYVVEPYMHKVIVDLVHLRYLPPILRHFRISKLFKAWNLQTLSVFEDEERNYLEFPQLQYFYCYSSCKYPPNFVHQNLQSISSLEPCHCTEEFFTNIPYIKKLRISGERRDCSDCIEKLVYLQQLERLYIYGSRWRYARSHVVPINNHITLLKNFKKLSFESMSFEWKEIHVLTKLHRLEVLKLINACVGEEWELPEEEIFRELICLEIHSTNLKHWNVSYNSLPKLECLLLCSCKKLEEIPTDFAEILTLKSIIVKGCLPSVVTSAKQIQEEQRDYGNENMVVIVEENNI